MSKRESVIGRGHPTRPEQGQEPLRPSDLGCTLSLLHLVLGFIGSFAVKETVSLIFSV